MKCGKRMENNQIFQVIEIRRKPLVKYCRFRTKPHNYQLNDKKLSLLTIENNLSFAFINKLKVNNRAARKKTNSWKSCKRKTKLTSRIVDCSEQTISMLKNNKNTKRSIKFILVKSSI